MRGGDPRRYVPEEKRLARDLGPHSQQHDVNHGADSSIELHSRRILADVTHLEEQLCDHPTETMNDVVGVNRPKYTLFLPGLDVGYDDVPGCIPLVEKLLVQLTSLQQHEGSEP
jgi:hypothetical protein